MGNTRILDCKLRGGENIIRYGAKFSYEKGDFFFTNEKI